MKNIKDKLEANKKLLMYGIFAACLLIANYSLFLKPNIASLKANTPALAEMKRQLAIDKALVANISGFQSQIENTREAMASFNKRFSTRQEISALLEDLSEIAKDSDVKIVSIRPHKAIDVQSDSTAVGVYQKFPISINAVCGYHKLGAFLHRFAREDTFMTVADIKIVSDQKDPSQHMVYLLVNTYVVSET